MKENQMTIGDEIQRSKSLNQNLLLSSSVKHVNYSCGACGYQLNLNSGNRDASIIGSKYQKSIKRGIISFFSIDESRFTQVEERRWTPYFNSMHSWGLVRKRTKLLCHKCGNHIGEAYRDNTSSHQLPLRKSQSMPWDGLSDCNKVYDIKIRALQPSSSSDERWIHMMSVD